MLTKSENISYLKSCKICGNNKLIKVINLNEQYISATFVKSNEDNDLKKIKTTLNLLLCSNQENSVNCGHLQLQEIINPDLLYRNYFYRSATSDTMRRDLKDVVDKALEIAKPKSQEEMDFGKSRCSGRWKLVQGLPQTPIGS